MGKAARPTTNRTSRAKAKAKAAATSSAALAALSATTPLFDQVEDEEALARTTPRKKRSRTMEECVQKAIRDNFPGFRPGQATMLMNDQGKTLYQVLMDDRRAIDLGLAGAPVLGKLYYEQKRKEFTYSDAPQKKLKVKDDRELLNNDLVQALEQLHKHPKSYEDALEFLGSGPALNQRSLVLLFLQALQFNPNGGPEPVGFLVNLVKFCHRHGVHTAYPVEWGLVRSHLDEALVRSLSQWKSSNLKAKVWWESLRSHLDCFVPLTACDECMNAVDDYAKVEKSLCEVVQSSQLGMKLFGAVHRQYQSTKVSQIIKEEIGKLVGQNVTLARVTEHRQEFLKKMTDMGRDPRENHTKRPVELTYRGVLVPVVVHSHYDEYLMSEAAQLESMAVDVGVVSALFCEDSLVPQNRAKPTIHIDLEVVNSAVVARKAAAAALIVDAPCGDAILASLTSHQAHMAQLHRAWRVTMAFWHSVVGEGSERRLKDEILKCLPSDTKKVSVEVAAAALDELSRSKLVSFCGLGLQSMFSSVQTFVSDIRSGKAPKYDGTNDSPFLKQIMAAVALFLTWKKPGAAGSADTPTLLYGKDAAVAKLEHLTVQRELKLAVSLADMADLQVYAWLLDGTEREKVAQMADDIIKQDIVGAASSAALSSAQPVPKRAGRRKVQLSARDAVLSLLST